MIYEIWRATDFRRENKPCKKAFQYKGNTLWYIEINNLDDLNNLIEEVGTIIIDNKFCEITIYDYYIE